MLVHITIIVKGFIAARRRENQRVTEHYRRSGVLDITMFSLLTRCGFAIRFNAKNVRVMSLSLRLLSYENFGEMYSQDFECGEIILSGLSCLV